VLHGRLVGQASADGGYRMAEAVPQGQQLRLVARAACRRATKARSTRRARRHRPH
jgi:hypothetical protein